MNRARVAVMVAACVLVAWAGGDARAAAELRVTPQLERTVRRGLDFLARTQQPGGSWPDSNGKLSGVVGLAMMTFLAHGEVPDEGRYGAVIRRAVNYMITTQQSNGLLCGRHAHSAMYSHGFATLALAEVYGVIDDRRVGPALKRAVGLIVRCQNALGGWRYSVGSSDADTTVSGAQMMALRAGANAGIEVPRDTIQRGVAYYKRCFCPGGGFGYTAPSGPNDARAGIGLLVLSLSGEYRSPEAKATADWLFTRGGVTERHYFYYACYYCSQAMFQAGGKYWRQWNDQMTPTLIAMQKPDGSWSGHSAGGTTCGTAFALLALEVNYGLLPIYQR